MMGTRRCWKLLLLLWEVSARRVPSSLFVPRQQQPISSRFRSRFAPPTHIIQLHIKAACMLALSKLGRLPSQLQSPSGSRSQAPTALPHGAPMDQMGMTDAEGGRVVHRPRRAGGRLAVVVAVQNVLVVVCLLVTVYVYWDAQKKTPSEDIVHIQFAPIRVSSEKSTLWFSHAVSRNSIDFDENTDKIYIRCTGPYILHMNICYKSLKDEEETQETELILQLQVEGSKTPAGIVKLQPSREVCRGLHSIAYLRAKEVASLHLNSTTVFVISNVTVGLTSLQGKRCYTY